MLDLYQATYEVLRHFTLRCEGIWLMLVLRLTLPGTFYTAFWEETWLMLVLRLTLFGGCYSQAALLNENVIDHFSGRFGDLSEITRQIVFNYLYCFWDIELALWHGSKIMRLIFLPQQQKWAQNGTRACASRSFPKTNTEEERKRRRWGTLLLRAQQRLRLKRRTRAGRHGETGKNTRFKPGQTCLKRL